MKKKFNKRKFVDTIQSSLVLTMIALGCVWTWLTAFRVVGLVALYPNIFIPLSALWGLLSFSGLVHWISS